MVRGTETSRQQHVELRRLADLLVALLEGPAQLDGPAVHDALGRIGTVLKAHVELEVEGMYPQLLEHPDADIRTLSARMIHRIKDVYDGFATFRSAWSIDKIRSNPEMFVKQARFVAQALHESTISEERDLYQRVDAAFAELRAVGLDGEP